MWSPLFTLEYSEPDALTGVWFSPEGRELLLLSGRETVYWSLTEKKALWTIQEKNGGEGISPDGRVYRDPASGLFYPLWGAHGGRQLREHPVSGQILVEEKTGAVALISADGNRQELIRQDGFGDWLVAGFCSSGNYIFIAGTLRVVVFGLA